MTFCTQCGNRLEDDARFCSECGNKSEPLLPCKNQTKQSSHKNGIAWDHKQKYGYLTKRVAGGIAHTAAIMYDDTVRICGANGQGQCDADNWTNVKSVACSGTATFALKKDGTIQWCGIIPVQALKTKSLGGTYINKWPATIIDICASIGADDHVLGLSSDGRVYAFGGNCAGQCNVGDWRDVVQIAAYHTLSVGVRKDGTVLTCGSNENIREKVSAWRDIECVYTGLFNQNLVGLKTDGTVVTTADYPEVSAWRGIIDIVCSGDIIVGLTANGEEYFAGELPGALKRTTRKGVLAINLALSSATTILQNNQVIIDNIGEDVESIPCKDSIVVSTKGYSHVIDIHEDGTVSAVSLTDSEAPLDQTDGWLLLNPDCTQKSTSQGGENVSPTSDAPKKDVSTNSSKTEVPLVFSSSPLSPEKVEMKNNTHKTGMAWEHEQKYGYLKNRLGGGFCHSVGVMYDGTVRACGGNGFGQCDVHCWSDVIAVACTGGATLGLRKDGTVLYTGRIPFNAEDFSAYGTHPARWTNVKAIAGCLHSADHAVGLLEDGKVVAFGCNEDGQCNVADWSDIIEISVQHALTAGVRKDGTVVVCGKDSAIKNIVAKWTNIEHLYEGIGEQSLIGLKYDGTIVSTENDQTFDMSAWRGIIDISVGISCVAGLSGNGHLFLTGKVPQDMFVEGINGVLCVNANHDAIIAAKNDHTMDMIILKKGVADKTNEKIDALGFQTGMMHKLIIQQSGGVVTPILSEQMNFGQDNTDDWMLMKPVDKPNCGSTPTCGGGVNAPVQKKKGGCYVATCVYGSYDCPQVWTLRRYRDNTLATTWYGRLFIRIYYAVSPVLVNWFGNTNWFKRLWKGILDRMIAKLQSDGVEHTSYEDKNW